MSKKTTKRGKLHFCPNCEHEWIKEGPPYWSSGSCPNCKKIVTYMFPLKQRDKFNKTGWKEDGTGGRFIPKVYRK